MADEHILKKDALDALTGKITVTGRENADAVLQYMKDISNKIKSIEPANVVPYFIAPDGTLTVTVPKGTEVSRVLVQEDGTQWGGLFYAD